MEALTYFRRRAFHGEYNTTAPKWHISWDALVPEFGVARALCGYTQWNIRGVLLLSRSATPKPRGEMCAKCQRRLDDAPSVS